MKKRVFAVIAMLALAVGGFSRAAVSSDGGSGGFDGGAYGAAIDQLNAINGETAVFQINFKNGTTATVRAATKAAAAAQAIKMIENSPLAVKPAAYMNAKAALKDALKSSGR